MKIPFCRAVYPYTWYPALRVRQIMARIQLAWMERNDK